MLISHFLKRTLDSDRQIYGAVTSVMQFVVPFVIMAFAYTKVIMINLLRPFFFSFPALIGFETVSNARTRQKAFNFSKRLMTTFPGNKSIGRRTLFSTFKLFSTKIQLFGCQSNVHFSKNSISIRSRMLRIRSNRFNQTWLSIFTCSSIYFYV